MNLQQFQAEMSLLVGESFAQASEHPYSCKCDKCKDWWARMGRDPDSGKFGPFTDEEIFGPDEPPAS